MSFYSDHKRGLDTTGWIAGPVIAVALFVVAGIACFHLFANQNDPFWNDLRWWMALTLILYIIANFVYLASLSSKTIHIDPAMMFSIFWAVAAAVVLIICCRYIYPEPIRQAHAFVSIATGCVFGWALGMYVSPHDSSEQARFAKIASALAGLASGYTIKSVQTWITQSENQHYQIYCLLASVSAVLTAATIYNVRAYGVKAIKISFDHEDPKDNTKVLIKATDVVAFKAAVVGEDDTSVLWSVVPDQKTGVVHGKFSSDGKFTPDTTTIPASGCKCNVLAQSSANRKLVDMVEVSIVV